MKKRVFDIAGDELAAIADLAGRRAIADTLAAGVPVTGLDSASGTIVTLHPDGASELAGDEGRAWPDRRASGKIRPAGAA